MTHDENDKLPLMPMRTVRVALPAAWLDQLDALRRDDPAGFPSRSELVRQAVRLFLALHELPPEQFGAIVKTVYDIEDAMSGIGEPQGNA